MSEIIKNMSIVVVTALIIGGVTYFTVNQKNIADENALNTQVNVLQSQVDTLTEQVKALSGTTVPSLTNDQIYQEVATQLKLTRSEIVYFRIFGSDKVQYSVNSGNIFAYKTDGIWKQAGPDSPHAILDCSTLTEVPEMYRPPCSDGSSRLYMDSTGRSTNYPPAQMVSYIGQ